MSRRGVFSPHPRPLAVRPLHTGKIASIAAFEAAKDRRLWPCYTLNMSKNGPSSLDSERRVVSFRRGRKSTRPPTVPSPPVGDLAKYERSEGPDDYRHRMIVNVLAFMFVIGLIAAGLWLADTMARMRKDHDWWPSG